MTDYLPSKRHGQWDATWGEEKKHDANCPCVIICDLCGARTFIDESSQHLGPVKDGYRGVGMGQYCPRCADHVTDRYW